MKKTITLSLTDGMNTLERKFVILNDRDAELPDIQTAIEEMNYTLHKVYDEK